MVKRSIGGYVFLILGILIALVSLTGGVNIFLAMLIYSLPLTILGIVILLNKNEDRIERIKHLKMLKKDSITSVKGGKKYGKK